MALLKALQCHRVRCLWHSIHIELQMNDEYLKSTCRAASIPPTGYHNIQRQSVHNDHIHQQVVRFNNICPSQHRCPSSRKWWSPLSVDHNDRLTCRPTSHNCVTHVALVYHRLMAAMPFLRFYPAANLRHEPRSAKCRSRHNFLPRLRVRPQISQIGKKDDESIHRATWRVVVDLP